MPETSNVKPVQMSMNRDKFLQFTRDMKQALVLVEQAQQNAQEAFKEE